MSTHLTLRTAIKTSLPLVGLLALMVSGCAAEPAAPPAQPTATQQDSSPAEAAPAPDPVDPAPEPAVPANPGLDQATLDGLLREAAWANDLEATARLVAWGADVNAKDSTQQSAYLISTSEGHLELLRMTLAHGANVESLDSWNGTGLIRAAERGHWDVVGELIQNGVPLNHVNRVGYQAIHEDVWMGRDDATYHATTRVLFAGGADFATPSVSEGMTPLQMANYRGFSGQETLIQSLLNEPVPADPTTALLTAAEAGNSTAVASALRAGADGSAENANGLTAFEVARAGGHTLAAQLLGALGWGSAA